MDTLQVAELPIHGVTPPEGNRALQAAVPVYRPTDQQRGCYNREPDVNILSHL
jgi:hypothetical protein